MATPTTKSPAINQLLSALAGKDREQTIQGNNCMTCNGSANEFKDNLSRREYAISGMCQVCQDATFTGDNK